VVGEDTVYSNRFQVIGLFDVKMRKLLIVALMLIASGSAYSVGKNLSMGYESKLETFGKKKKYRFLILNKAGDDKQNPTSSSTR
jgi:hypothetical protein